MLRRYVLASLVVFAVAFAVAIGLYLHDSVSYAATCRFRVQPAPTTTQSTSDYFAFAGLVAQREVALAQSAPVFSHAADDAGLDAGTLAGETFITPGPGTAYFSVQVTDSDSFRAARAANAVCDAMTAQIKQQRAAEQKSETDALTTKLVDLFSQRQALTAQPPTQAGQAQILSIDKAITGVESQLAASQALPPDTIDVLARAGNGTRNDQRNLGRNLLIAVVAGLLGSFLIVLIGEAVADRTRPPVAEPLPRY
jgi:capsular polysaccharide biosynthesis protein